MSQKARKRVEEIFGWMKTVGGHRKTRYRGTQRVSWAFIFAAAAYNQVRPTAKARMIQEENKAFCQGLFSTPC